MMSRNAALLIAFGFAALVSSTAAQAVGYYDYGRYNKPIVTYSDAARVVDRDLSYQSDLLALSAPTAPGRRFVRKQAKDLQLIETYLDSEAEKEKEKRKDHSHGSRRRTLKEDYTEYEDEAQEDDLLADIAKSHVKQEQGVLAKVKPTTAAGARARWLQTNRVRRTKAIQKGLQEEAEEEEEEAEQAESESKTRAAGCTPTTVGSAGCLGRRTLNQANVYDQLAAQAKSQAKQQENVLATVDPSSAAGARARHAQSQLVKKTKSAQKELERRANAERQRENNERERQNCRSAHQSTQARLNAGESPRTLPATTARCKQLLGIPRG